MSNRDEMIRDHQERLNRVTRHIQAHLDEPLTLETLAAVACFSPFHFHRLFAGYTGEPLKSYVRRLRLEQAAHRLCHTPERVTDIALRAGYETPAAFTRAFVQRFGESPTRFRKEHGAWVLQTRTLIINNQQEEVMLKPEIRNQKEKTMICVRRTGPYAGAAKAAWDALCGWAGPRGLIAPNAEFIGIGHDDPEITAEDKLRYDACITVDRPVKPEGEVSVQKLAGGRYAVFTLQGPYDGLAELYRAIYGQWLPASGMKLRNVTCYERYLNDCGKVKPQELLTEICIPVE